MTFFDLVAQAEANVAAHPTDSLIKQINRLYTQTGCALFSAKAATKEAQRKAGL